MKEINQEENIQRVEVYTVYDKIKESCGPLQPYNNDAEAIRAFKAIDFKVFPRSDFQLYHVMSMAATGHVLDHKLRLVYEENENDIVKVYKNDSKE